MKTRLPTLYLMQCFKPSAPTRSPTAVAATAVSPTSIMVTWDIVPPIDQNGVITMYELLYEPLETCGAIVNTTVDGTARAVNLTGLEEYVNYTISVRAYTSAGEGPYSDGVTVVTFEDGRYFQTCVLSCC